MLAYLTQVVAWGCFLGGGSQPRGAPVVFCGFRLQTIAAEVFLSFVNMGNSAMETSALAAQSPTLPLVLFESSSFF